MVVLAWNLNAATFRQWLELAQRGGDRAGAIGAGKVVLCFVGVSVAVCALLGPPHSMALSIGLLTWPRLSVPEHWVEVNHLLWPSFERHTVPFPLHSGQWVKKVVPESRGGDINPTSRSRLVNEFADIV